MPLKKETTNHQLGWMGFPCDLFPIQVGLHGGWGSVGPMKNIHKSWLLPSKRYLSDSDSETESDFPRFIIFESLQDIRLHQLSPFLIKKNNILLIKSEKVKKLWNGNLLMEIETKKRAENLLKMEKFHNLKCRGKLNTSKGVVRSKELSLVTPEEIETAFKKIGSKRIQKSHYTLKWNHTDPYIHSDLWKTINTKRNQNWLHDRKGRALYTNSSAVLQMSKIWTLLRDLQRVPSMWQM